MKWVRFAVVIFLLGTLTIQADPFKTWHWEGPTEYENNLPIPIEDILSFDLYCGPTEGGPYELFSTMLSVPSPNIHDMGPLVQNTPGTYYCVSTATSMLHGLESAYSNEVNFTVLPSDLGLRPKPSVLSFGS